jgi:hypothetical protein
MSHYYGLPVFSSRVDIVNKLHGNQETHKVKHLLSGEIIVAGNFMTQGKYWAADASVLHKSLLISNHSCNGGFII